MLKRADLIDAQAGLHKADETDLSGGIPDLLRLLRTAFGPIQDGAKILDFGCGVGNGVHTLLGLGYDAYGVDVFEFWGADADLYWEGNPRSPTPEAQSRLKVAGSDPYTLPFEDDSFDHVISAQVFEHVLDYPRAFSEIARVLKPGGTSAHIFPGRWFPLMEGHINVPVAPFCFSSTYLKAAAILGFRSIRQKGMGWREVHAANVAQMKLCIYPTNRQVLKWAREAGLEARIANSDHIRKSGSGWTRLHSKLSRFGMGWAVHGLAKVRLQRMLVLRKPSA